MTVSRLRRGKDREAEKKEGARDSILKPTGDQVKSLGGPDETDEMSGDDGIVPDLGESVRPCGEWRESCWSDLFKNEMEREDGEGRLEGRLPAPWDREEGRPGGQEARKKSKKEERNRRRSMKVHSKDKIGNIDINVLQRELCNDQVQA